MSEVEEPDEDIRALFRATVNSPSQEFSVWMEEVGPHAIKRLIGCWIVIAMPEEGLDEALTSLREIFEFAYEDSRLMLPQPTKHQVVSGKSIKGTKRPDLVISE